MTQANNVAIESSQINSSGVLQVAGGGTGTTTSTGSGSVVLSTSPTLTTPALGTPSSGVATNLTGTASGLSIGGNAATATSATSATTATNATNIAITDNTSSSATWYPTIVSNTSGNLPQTTSSTKLSFVPSTGNLTSTVLTSTNDAFINGLTVGRGAGNAASNTAFGSSALTTNSSGVQCVAIGYQSFLNNTSGNGTAIGYQALKTNTTGVSNTAVGNSALLSNTGSYNVGIGESALQNNSSGQYNVAVGNTALQANTTASNNTAVGYQAGYYITTGSYNTILGRYNGNQGGLDIRTASNYVVLSEGTGSPVMVFNNSGNASIGSVSPTTGYEKLSVMQSGSSSLTGLAVGYGTSSATYRSAYVYSNGNFYFNNGNNEGYLSSAGTWTNASDARLKKNITDIKYGLNAVMQTQPRSYNMISTEGDFVGFIAQELKNIIPEVVSGGEVDEEHPDGKQYGVDYGSLVAVAFKAIQELKAEFDAYKAIHP
jgi:hypothetical protein